MPHPRARRLPFRLLGALCALLLPTPALAQSVLETHYETVYDDYNAKVLTTGAVVFTASYGASVVVAATAQDDSTEPSFERLYIPVAGPWLALSEHGDCPIANPSCDAETTTKLLLIADGLFQAAGVLAMVDGLLEPSSRRVRVRSSSIGIAPTVVKGDPGVSVFGRF